MNQQTAHKLKESMLNASTALNDASKLAKEMFEANKSKMTPEQIETLTKAFDSNDIAQKIKNAREKFDKIINNGNSNR